MNRASNIAKRPASSATAVMIVLLAALALAACNGDGDEDLDAAEALAETHGYEPGHPALVFVYTDG